MSERIKKPMKCTNGYYEVLLNKDNKVKPFLVHRLVAKAFISNPNNLKEVNHKDENIANNHVENLEWCTSKYNANYGTRNERVYESRRYKYRKIRQYDLNGQLIKEWDSIADAGRYMNVNCASISRVCRGQQHTSMGYVWKYAN